MKAPPPLRFLGGVIGLWVCFRAAVLAPDWIEEVEAADRAPDTPVTAPAFAAPADEDMPPTAPLTIDDQCRSCPAEVLTSEAILPGRVSRESSAVPQVLSSRSSTGLVASGILASPAAHPQLAQVELPGIQAVSAASFLPSAAGRWSGSAWALVRRGEAASLVAGGMLGGSQIGARLDYRLNGDPSRPLTIAARLYSPLNRRAGAEAALGIEWQPLARLPLRLLAERRQALGPEGRSAFSILAHGGVHDLRLAGPVRINAYAQAGAVGIKSRDLFADGAARAELPVAGSGRIRLGAGAWGAAQRGIARFDVGPTASLIVPAAGRNLRLSVDWRIAVAGGAAPGSGPALTLGTDF